jgi:restriction endonuclease Mrr
MNPILFPLPKNKLRTETPNISTKTTINSSPKTISLEESLLWEQLLTLPFDSFLEVVARLLIQMGYQIERRDRTQWKGRNRDGGSDMLVSYQWGKTRRTVAVQVKQYPIDRKVMQRSLDEMRGVCLRQGASEGLLITTSGYSSAISNENTAVAPLSLMDGHDLVQALLKHDIDIANKAKSARPVKPSERPVKSKKGFRHLLLSISLNSQ